MAVLKSLSKRAVEGLSAPKDTVFWSRDLPGFGVRVYPSGARVYVVQSRGPQGPKRVTVGRHGVVSASQARRRAALLIARIKAGEAPAPALPAAARGGPTVAALAARYLREHAALRCKPRTAEAYRRTIGKHILPALGGLPLAALGRGQVAALHDALRATPAAANAAVDTLSRMLNQAEAWGMAPEGGNPCRFVPRYKERKRERFLTEAEFRRLGRALRALEAEGRLSTRGAAALRLLMLTGCRRNEIATLRWEDVRLEARELRLPDSKTGPRIVPLSPKAAAVLTALPRVAGSPWVFPGRKPGARISNLNEHWSRVRAHAGLPDVRLHDLRHSFASRALALGEGLPAIGRLLGHAQAETTARYVHLARDSVAAAATRIAASIASDMLASEDA